MKYCTNCGNELKDEAVICPKCGTQVGEIKKAENEDSKAPKVLGILSVVFGALGGIAGLVLGIIGLCIDKKKKYRVLNIVGICLFALWVVIAAII